MMLGKNNGAVETCQRIPKGSVGVEIGVWRGDSSEIFLSRAAHLHLVDPWSVVPYEEGSEFSREEYFARYAKIVGSQDPREFQAYYDRVAADVVARFRAQPVTIHRSTSMRFFETFDGKVDWIYIDGAHSFEGCLEDLKGACKIVKPGGAIFGDDYGNKDGVTKAVQEFLNQSDLTAEIFGRNQYEIRL